MIVKQAKTTNDRRFLSCQYDEARLEGNRKEDKRPNHCNKRVV